VPQRLRSRLQSQARAEALIRVPEGVGELKAGEMAGVQMLTPLSLNDWTLNISHRDDVQDE